MFDAAGKLEEAYPRLFQNGHGIGVGFGPGWIGLLMETFHRLNQLLDDEQVKRFEINQIKEKFGDLRFYYTFFTDREHDDEGLVNAVDAIITEAENRSSEICEDCGGPGVLDRKNGWYRTTCGCRK